MVGDWRRFRLHASPDGRHGRPRRRGAANSRFDKRNRPQFRCTAPLAAQRCVKTQGKDRRSGTYRPPRPRRAPVDHRHRRPGDGRRQGIRDSCNEIAVGRRLSRPGRIVTAAALLMAISFSALMASGVSIRRMFGLGLTLAVLMDATLVRLLLVPAFMHVLGRANW